MGPAFGIVNIVAESKYVFMELIDILKYDFDLNVLTLALKIDRLADRLRVFIHVTDISDDAFRLMELSCFLTSLTAVFKIQRQIRIQIGGLMQTVFDIGTGEICILENFRIRKEGDRGPGFFGFPDYRKQPVLQLLYRNTTAVAVVENLPFTADGNIHPFGKRVDNRRTHAVQTAACFVYIIVKFSARVQRCQNDPFRGYAPGMHPGRNAASIIPDGAASVRIQRDADTGTVSGQMLVN